MWPIYPGKRAGSRNSLWEGPYVRFNTDFKVAIINMFKELKEIMIKELKKCVISRSQQIETINKELEIINEMEILGMKSTIIEMYHLLKGLNTISELREEETASLMIIQ